MRSLTHLFQNRLVAREIALYGSVGDTHNGIFAFRIEPDKKPGPVLHCVASNGFGWDHVSVTVANLKKPRCPTWEEMTFVRNMFFKTDEVVMELHVAAKDHISLHDHCLHLWRPQGEQIPLPPTWMVGPRQQEVANA